MDKDKVYFFVAGSLGVWLIEKMHRSLERSFLLDVGQAFNQYFEYQKGFHFREFGREKEDRHQHRNVRFSEADLGSSMVLDAQGMVQMTCQAPPFLKRMKMLAQELLKTRWVKRKWGYWQYRRKFK